MLIVFCKFLHRYSGPGTKVGEKGFLYLLWSETILGAGTEHCNQVQVKS